MVWREWAQGHSHKPKHTHTTQTRPPNDTDEHTDTHTHTRHTHTTHEHDIHAQQRATCLVAVVSSGVYIYTYIYIFNPRFQSSLNRWSRRWSLWATKWCGASGLCSYPRRAGHRYSPGRFTRPSGDMSVLVPSSSSTGVYPSETFLCVRVNGLTLIAALDGPAAGLLTDYLRGSRVRCACRYLAVRNKLVWPQWAGRGAPDP